MIQTKPNDTPGEAAARAALRHDLDRQAQEVHLAGETISLMRAGMREDVRDAVREGMAEVLSDENVERLFSKFFEVLHRQATERTGRFVLGGLTVMFKRVVWVGLLVGAVYMVGGWSLLKAVWAAINKG